MNGQLAAILWAQWRSLLNLYPKRDRAGMLFTAVITFFWYGIWVVAASGVALLVSESRDNAALERFLATMPA